MRRAGTPLRSGEVGLVLARSVVVSVRADDVEALVELDVDLATAVERDLDPQ